jgi:hypothetical protein
VNEVARTDKIDASEPAGNVGEPSLTRAEVKQLWWFLDGAIMAPDVRAHVRRSWGFCARHSWGFAAAELQLRGGRPFATSILYEDLTRRAAKLLARHGRLVRARTLRRLEPQEPCFTCEYVALGGEDDPTFQHQQERANRLDRVKVRLEETRGEWERHSCPLCLGGGGLVCRQHLLGGTEPSADLDAQLVALADRLQALVGSLTTRATPVGPLEEASGVEALGWFAGWDYPRRLVG